MSIESIRWEYSWPDSKPDFEFDPHGWFGEGNRRMLRSILGAGKFNLIVEMGSWLGASTRFIADNAPNATIICIDHWLGSPEHHLKNRDDIKDKINNLDQRFLSNCWEYRDRIIPVKETTDDGMRKVKEHGIGDMVQLVYIDAGHEEENVLNDILHCSKYTPNAIIMGDDWLRGDSVKNAVKRYVAIADETPVLKVDDSCWALFSLMSRPSYVDC